MKVVISILFLSLSALRLLAQTAPESLRLGVSADYPPFEFLQKGRVVGFDIELAERIAADLGKSLVIEEMDFDALIPALQSGRIDFAMSGITASPERQAQVSFSLAYYRPRFTFIFPESAPIKSVYELESKRIGTQTGSTMAFFLKQIEADVPPFELLTLSKIPNLIQELRLSRLDAVLLEEPQAHAFAQKYPDLAAAALDHPSADLTEGYAIAFRKGSELLDAFNERIQALQEAGFLDQLQQKWITKSDSGPQEGSRALDWILFVVKGAGLTLSYTLLALLLGLLGGILIAMGQLSSRGSLKWLSRFYVSIFRGTPVLVQLLIVYYALPHLTGIRTPPLFAGILAFGLNSSAYVSEIIRAGIASVSKGQYEAAASLSIPKGLMFKDIILPQAFKTILPALVNEAVNLLKESAIVSMIGEMDLMKRAQLVSAERYDYFGPLLVAAAVYYLLVLILSSAAQRLEIKLNQGV